MLHQKGFYKQIDALPAKVHMVSKFRQVGDIFEAGYLPAGSIGTCSFTTLDFHRAVSQGCEKEWMDAAAKAKERSPFWQKTFGEQGNAFGARQQLDFLSPDDTAQDPLFTRSLPAGKQQLTGDQTQNASRHKQVVHEVFSPNDLSSSIKATLATDPEAYMRINFDLEDKKGGSYGHTIAICPAGQGDNLYIMDPNVGVILAKKTELKGILDTLRSTLYKDFLMGQTSMETQDKFWLAPDSPLTQRQIDSFRREETGLLNRVTIEDYKAYQKTQQSLLDAVDDLDVFVFDDESSTEDSSAKVTEDLLTTKVESVFDEGGWTNLPEAVVPQNTVLTGAHEYRAYMTGLKAPKEQKTNEEDHTEDWEVINKNTL